MVPRVSLLLICCLIACGMMTGCGKKPNPDGRQDVSGRITLNGAPLINGTINFSDKSPENAGGAGGLISNGKYTLTGEYGIKPGTYTVRIYGARDYDRVTGEVATDQTPMGNLVAVNLVPDEYNKKSELTFTVEEGKKNVFNLEMTADEPVIQKDGRSTGL